MGSAFDTEKFRIICESKVQEVLEENSTNLSGLTILYCLEHPDFSTLASHIKLEIIPVSPQRVGLGPSAIFRHKPRFVVNMVSKKRETETIKKMNLFIGKLTDKLINKEIDSVVFMNVRNNVYPIAKDWENKVASFEMMYDEFING